MDPEPTGKFTPRNGKICCIFTGDGDAPALWVLSSATAVTLTKGRVPVETLTVQYVWSSWMFEKKRLRPNSRKY